LVDCTRLPLVPVIVTLYIFGVVNLLVDSVRVDVPLAVSDVGEKDAPMLDGRPETSNDTSPVNPLTGATVNVKVAERPRFRDAADGEADSVKSAVGVGGGVPGHPEIALWTLSLPPVVVIPASAATLSTPPSSALINAAVCVVEPHPASTSAAAPDTCGVAIDVPLM
jgi:hypothetical protein